MTDQNPIPLPQGVPDDGERARLIAWQQLAADSGAGVEKIAASWRTGLAAVLTAISALMLLKGPDLTGVPDAWLWTIVVLFLLAAGGLCASLLLTLFAEAPPPTILSYDKTVSPAEQTRQRYEAAAKKLHVVRWTAPIGFALFLGAIGVWWVAPAAAKPAVQVVYTSGSASITVCGTLGDGKDKLTVTSKSGEGHTVAFADVTAITPVDSCP
ncbi:MAG: hypothetical protein QM713_10885 [Arachnia sp.]